MWESILWFVIFGLLFYFMMRVGGCGGHVHGGHYEHAGSEHHDDSAQGNWTVRDPVCGAQGPASQAAASTEYGGRTWYFCSPNCRDTFLKEPAKYAAAEPAHAGGGHHGC